MSNVIQLPSRKPLPNSKPKSRPSSGLKGTKNPNAPAAEETGVALHVAALMLVWARQKGNKGYEAQVKSALVSAINLGRDRALLSGPILTEFTNREAGKTMASFAQVAK